LRDTQPVGFRDEPERVFLDANILRGFVTTDVPMSLADREVIQPFWSERVMTEARNNRPSRISEEKFDYRTAEMNRAYPEAMVGGFEHLEGSMPAHPGIGTCWRRRCTRDAMCS
jgi:hypothetical protein